MPDATWNRGAALRVLALILVVGAAAGFLALRSQRLIRAHCQGEYALARSAADTARIDRETFPPPTGRALCRDYRLPPRRPVWPPN